LAPNCPSFRAELSSPSLLPRVWISEL